MSGITRTRPASPHPVLMSAQDIDHALAQKVGRVIRRALMDAALGAGVHRDSPTAGVYLENTVRLSLMIDLRTGGLLSQADPDRDMMTFEIWVNRDNNQIYFTHGISGLQRALERRDLHPSIRSVLGGLCALEGSPLSVEGRGPVQGRLLGAGADAPAEVVEALPPGHGDHMRRDMRRILGLDDGGQAQPMTICAPALGTFGDLFSGPLGCYVGHLALSGKGDVIGFSFCLPDRFSARGTERRGGIAGVGLQVPA